MVMDAGMEDAGFQSTLPVWGATRESRGQKVILEFQSTLPVWGATNTACIRPTSQLKFQSTLPVWGATPTQ